MFKEKIVSFGEFQQKNLTKIAKKYDFKAIYSDLSFFALGCSTPRIHRIYEDNIERSKKFAHKLWKWLKAITVIAFFPKIIGSFYRYYIKNLGEKSFQLILASK